METGIFPTSFQSPDDFRVQKEFPSLKYEKFITNIYHKYSNFDLKFLKKKPNSNLSGIWGQFSGISKTIFLTLFSTYLNLQILKKWDFKIWLISGGREQKSLLLR